MDCKEALDAFSDNAKIKKPNSAELRAILRTELKKHINDPNYDKFEWEITADDIKSKAKINKDGNSFEMI